MTPWQMAWAHLTRFKAQSFMLLLSLAFSIGAAGLLLRTYTLSQLRFQKMAKGGQAIVGGKDGGIDILLGSLNLEAENPHPLPLNLFNSLRNGQTVKFEDGSMVNSSQFISSVIPLLFVGTNGNTKIIATDLSFFQRPVLEDSLSLKDGRFFTKDKSEVVLGSSVAARLGLKVGDVLTFGDHGKTEVVGVLNSTNTAWDHGAYIGLPYAYGLLSEKGPMHPVWRDGILHYYLIYMKPEGFKPLQSLINERTVGQIISVSEETEKLQELTGAGGKLGLGIIFFIILLSALSVAGMMMIRYEGMRLQGAVLRAMGFPISYLLKWLLGEGLILAAGACLIGAFMDLILFHPLLSLLGKAIPQTDILSATIFWSAPIWLGATLATIAGVIIPFRRFYKMDIHSILKGF